MIVTLAVFVYYASIWRPTKPLDPTKPTFWAVLDNNSVAPPYLVAGRGLPVRLELSPWLALIATLQRLSTVPLADLYNFYLPPLLLLLALCSAFLLGRQALNSRWATTLAVPPACALLAGRHRLARYDPL